MYLYVHSGSCAPATHKFSSLEDRFSGDAALAAFEMHQQQGNRRRRDSGNTQRLADRLRLDGFELLRHFGGEAVHLRIVEGGGNRRVLVPALAFDLLVLAL